MISKYFQKFLDDNDLKLGEEFMLFNTDGERVYEDLLFSIGDDDCGGLLECSDLEFNEDGDMYIITHSIFAEKFVPRKLPYKPSFGDSYWYIDSTRNVCMLDYILRRYNKCYRTRIEAIEHLQEDYKDLLIGVPE